MEGGAYKYTSNDQKNSEAVYTVNKIRPNQLYSNAVTTWMITNSS